MKIAAVAVVALLAGTAGANIRITEWMYDGSNNGEFLEITNVGNTAIDLTGWSFDDNSRTPGSLSLSAFGVLAAGESAIIAESDAATFRTRWNLGAGVKIIGSNTQNLGRADEINIYDALNGLVDRLTYDDQGLGGVRTQNKSANILVANLGANAASLAVASVLGDAFGSYASVGTTTQQIANPGQYIPTPGVLALLGVAGVVARRRRA